MSKKLDIATATKLRSLYDAMYQRNLQELDDLVIDPSSMPSELNAKLEVLRTNYNEMYGATEALLQMHFEAGKEDEFEAIYTERGALQMSFLKIEEKVGLKIHSMTPSTTTASTTAPPKSEVYRVSLPNKKLPKFGGDVRDWLTFWASFAVVHNDPVMPDSEKFEYLNACLVPDSDAAKAIEAFPFAAKNYALAINTLEKRFGQEKVLIKVYIRDLIQLAIENAVHPGKMPFNELVAKLSSKIQNLGELNVAITDCEKILYPLLESCIPDAVLEAWQRNANYDEKVDPLLDFLRDEVQRSLERSLTRMQFNVSSDRQKSKKQEDKPKDIATVSGFLNADASQKPPCVFCEGRHASHECRKAAQIPMDEKNELLKKKRACFKCFRLGHGSRNCRSSRHFKCQLCSGGHHLIMCPDLHANKEDKSKFDPPAAPPAQQAPVPPVEPAARVNCVNQTMRKEILLQTLTVVLHGKDGKKRRTRAAFDSLSQGSYVLDRVAQELRLEKIGSETVRHHTFQANISEPTLHELYKLEVSSLEGNVIYVFDVSGCAKISSQILGTAKGEWTTICANRGIQLTDTAPVSDEIELLIGADVFAKFFTGRKLELECGPVANETVLGWVISGKCPLPARMTTNMMCTVNMHIMDETVKQLWELEAIGITDPVETQSRKQLEQSALDHFLKTVARQEDGRYEVALPLLEGHSQLPNNFNQAKAILERTTADLKRKHLLQAYDGVFKSWEEQGIIEVVPAEELHLPAHYLPHRGVVKENSTTPLRPVFNASYKGKYGPSLNDCLERGPNLLELIPDVLIRFMLNRVGVVADIQKAFCQISVIPSDRDKQRFLWWNFGDNMELKVLRHNRVFFGNTSSPFCLAAVLNLHLDTSTVHQETAQLIKESLYVDNLATSLDSMAEAKRLEKQSQEILLPAHFNLRGWEFGPVEEEKKVMVLGLVWNTKADTLQLDLTNVLKKLDSPATKRELASTANMLFDPMGYACPFTLRPKLLLKRAFQLNLGWDTELPDNLKNDLEKWKSEVHSLFELKVPRWKAPFPDRSTWELHVFTDASSASFAAVVFLRTGPDHSPSVQLLRASNRVSPKNATIPRLELLGCRSGAILADKVKKAMKMENIPTTFYTDSSTALAWITHNANWATFVRNRVVTIREYSQPNEWIHVAGEHNPADLPSRGCTAAALVSSKWWENNFLSQPRHSWPKSHVQFNQEEIDKEKMKVVAGFVNKTTSTHLEHLLRFSSYNKVLRALAILIRFWKWVTCKPSATRVTPTRISVDELNIAEKMLFRYVQATSFTGVDDPQLVKLNPFVDSEGIIRIKTRLVFGDDEDHFKTPVVLPGKNQFVCRLIWEEHSRQSHAGVGILLATLRERFWILNGRRSIGNAILPCLKCRWHLAKKYESAEAPLPKSRIELGRTFQTVGVDLAGPLFVRGGTKVWIVLYTCAVYRAVHFELVESLSTPDFIDSLRRFVSRRGRPETVYSDNGKNFVGTYNAFEAVDWKKVEEYATVEKINWIFNPPSAAWWGGFWERLVGMMKQILRRVIGKSVVTTTPLYTVICEAEAVMNSRPLGYVSESPNDLRPLTPQMFLSGPSDSSASLPEADVVSRESLQQQHRHCQKLREALKSRFRNEYLGLLIHRGALNNRRPPEKNTFVLVELPDKKRLEWPLGIITAVYPGKDGVIRVARIKTKDGEYVRPIQRLYPLEVLPVEEEEIPDHSDAEAEQTVEDTPVEVEQDPEPVVITKRGRVVRKPQWFQP